MVRTIKTKISLAPIIYGIGCIACALIFIVGLASYFSLKRTYVQSVFERYNVTLQAIEENVTSYIQSQMRRAQTIAQNSEITQILKENPKQLIISDDEKKKILKISDQMIIFSPDHQPIFSSDGIISLYKNIIPLQESIERSQILFSPDISDFVFLPGKDPALYIVVPVIRDNQFLGSIATMLDMHYIKKIVSDYIGLDNTGEIIVVKKVNNEVTTLFPTRLHPDIAFKQYPDKTINRDAFSKALEGKSGTLITTNIVNSSLICWIYMPLPQWGIAIKSSYSEAVKPLRTITMYMILLALFSALGFFFCMYKAWSHLRQKHEREEIISKILLVILYAFFIINLVVLILFVQKKYYEYQQKTTKETLVFKGALQKAVQTVNYRATTLENIASSFVFDITGQGLKEYEIQERLMKILTDNLDIYGIILLSEKNNIWAISAYVSDKDHHAKPIVMNDSQIEDWKNILLKSPLGWNFKENLLQHSAQPFYTLSYYDPKDIERKTPVGVFGIFYTIDQMVESARQQIAHLPLILTLSDGTLLYKDSNIVWDDTRAYITSDEKGNYLAQSAHGTFYFEKIISLNWYLGSLFERETQKAKVFIFILELALLLCSIGIGIYSFVRCFDVKDNSTNYLEIHAEQLIMACSLIALSMSFIYWVAL